MDWPPQGSYASRLLVDALNMAYSPVMEAAAGDTLDLGQGVGLKVMCAGG